MKRPGLLPVRSGPDMNPERLMKKLVKMLTEALIKIMRIMKMRS